MTTIRYHFFTWGILKVIFEALHDLSQNQKETQHLIGRPKVTALQEELLSFSAWPYTQEQLEKANRIEELTFGETITLNIDYKQMGVGGDDTWNLDARPHEPFRIPAKPYSYSFKISPVR